MRQHNLSYRILPRNSLSLTSTSSDRSSMFILPFRYAVAS